jgi:pyruvate kinase
MKKTKIICSIGPASDKVEVMTEMVKAGMNTARINFSHATYEQNDEVLKVIKEVRSLTGNQLSILYDTKGPDFRCMEMKEEGVNLVEGATIKMVKDHVVGTEEAFSVNYPDAIDKISIGSTVLIDDGLFKFEVIDKDSNSVTLKVINGGVLTSKKGIAVPGCDLNLEFLSEVDKEDIKYACSHEGDFIALSFVESRKNIEDVREILRENGREDMQIISKVESATAVKNLDDIIDASDGIMVARGDLGVEVPIERLPIIQKDMITKCREKEKFVIVATEMLASMYTSPRPTRAEVTDISNAVLDGTDAVMLSGESTVGKYPVDAVSYMAKICEEAEKYGEYAEEFSQVVPNDITEAVASAVLTSSQQLEAKAIVVPTSGGHSARVISNLRPNTMILALCPNNKIARALSLNYGVSPVVIDIDHDDMDDVAVACKSVATTMLDLKEKDIIIICGGIHTNKDVKQTNFMKIEEI